MSKVAYEPQPVTPLFETLAGAGYTKCEHARQNRGVPMPYCRDCGAAEGVEGSLDFKREPLGL